MSNRNWSRAELIALLSVVITLISCVAAIFVVPEFRRALGLEESPALSDS